MSTKDRIVWGFKELALEQGFYSATVDQLASKLNMSKRTIYRYFSSKEDIIAAVMQQFMLETEQLMEDRLGQLEHPVDKITALMKIVSERLQMLNTKMLKDLQVYYPRIWEQVEQFRAEKIKHIIHALVEGSQHGLIKEINPVIVTASMLATIRAVINPSFLLENNITFEQAFQAVFDTFLYGIVKREQ